MNKIIWLTGHSKSGKTTLAHVIKTATDCIILDGDEMRDSISLGAGFSNEERREHNLRVARLAKTLAKQTNVVVSVIAPMIDVRREITEICDPVWIYVKRNIPEREGHFYEEPVICHYEIDNNQDFEQSLKDIRKIAIEVFDKKK
jgi:adenylylsulfate kinase-like enzyme